MRPVHQDFSGAEYREGFKIREFIVIVGGKHGGHVHRLALVHLKAMAVKGNGKKRLPLLVIPTEEARHGRVMKARYPYGG
jgi:hypothetical protein